MDLLIVSQDMPSNMADEQIAQFSDVAQQQCGHGSGKPRSSYPTFPAG
ncbi:MAG: hypothetical protein ACLRWP_19925 [Bilophila wadsworthia]